MDSEVVLVGLLDPRRLYLGDNGRCFCGTLACAGATAFYSKHDLRGQFIHRLTAKDAAGMKCEHCGSTHYKPIKEGKS